MLNDENFGDRSLRSRLLAGENVFGLFITEFLTPNWGPILDTVGYDFGIIDMEHGRFSLADLSNLLPGFRSCRSSALLRVPSIRREYFQVPLDLGITGLVVPMVETAEEVEQCVTFMKYGPRGKRGIAFGRPHTNFYTVVDRDKVTVDADDHTFLVIQVETERGLANLDEILAVDGIDVLFIGNADLSKSLCCPNTPNEGVLFNAMDRIYSSTKKKGIVCGGNLPDKKAVDFFGERYGLRFISLMTDIDLIQCGMQTVMNRVK